MRGKVNSVSGDNIKFIEKEYDSATVYNEGDTASIRGVLYSCLVNNTTGTLNMDRWKRVYLSDLAEITSSEQALADMVDEVYDPSKTYNKGDTALYNEVLYICKNDGTTGKWNADLWEQTTLVSILNSNLGGKVDGANIHTDGTVSVTKGQYLIVTIGNTSGCEAIFSNGTATLQQIATKQVGTNKHYNVQLTTTIYKVTASGNVTLTPYSNSASGFNCSIEMVVI